MSETYSKQLSKKDLHHLFTDKPSRVLFAVLNWGLGHATRSIPIIQYLLDSGAELKIASDGSALRFLQQEFPEVETISLRAYDIKYNAASVEYSMLMQLPGVFRAIQAEEKIAASWVSEWQPDLIISDSRFGFRSKQVKSIIIAHQLKLISDKLVFRAMGNLGNTRLLNRFDECWVPDFEGGLLSGMLSQKELQVPTKFIGPQSRFAHLKTTQDIDLLVVISGPEPKRTRFSEKLKRVLSNAKMKIVGVDGVVESTMKYSERGNQKWYNYLTSSKLNEVLNRSKLVLCRAGYSSIMDLTHLHKSAILIPTPGQAEQEYLGSHLNGKFGFTVISEAALEEQLMDTIRNLQNKDTH